MAPSLLYPSAKGDKMKSIVFSFFAFLGALAVNPSLGVTATVADATHALISVNVDGTTYQCTQGGTTTTSDFLISGTYKDTTSDALCPQAIQATLSGGVMTSLVVTYLSPCSGGSSTMTCDGPVCKGDGYTLTVLGRDQYYFLNSQSVGGRFLLN